MISKSFEIKDYMLEGALVNGFWMTLEDRENLTTEVVYTPAGGKFFGPAATGRMIREIAAKCDSFRSLLPENINCEVAFKDLDNLTYSANGKLPEIRTTEHGEIRVIYRFYVKYYI
ncbi:hypothetical protein [Methanolobus chelungpuianus]|uniref:hypothetical protein n=1 Tax=Methanolobus chelungpuianus TaxID=502115 RepID=UPI002114CF10